MADYQTGLEAVFAKHTDGSEAGQKVTGAADVIIAERRDVKIMQFSFFASQTADFKKHLLVFGISDIPDFSQVKKGKGCIAARVEMEKIWLIADVMPDAGRAKFYPLDLSSARAVVRLQGAKAGDVLARLCAVDWQDKSRVFIGTAIHHVPVHIHHQDGVFDIYMPRSYAVSLTELLVDISRQYHVQMA